MSWFRSAWVLAWLGVTTYYLVVRWTESLRPLRKGVYEYGVYVLVIEVGLS